MTGYENMPKVELHLHLEGAIPHHALWELIEKYGGDREVPSPESLRSRFIYKDFRDFIRVWCWKNQFLREYEDFTFIAESVARHLAAQHVKYVEAFYSPVDFSPHGLEVQHITEAIRKGLSRVSGIEVGLIVDLVRDYGSQRAAETLARVNEVKSLGVIGIGIGGSEDRYPPRLFESVYKEARALGFRTTVHAGETAGAESIWDAINKLKCDRLGHGTQAIEDERLMNFIAGHKIPLEMCPMSNVRTGVVSSIEDHPIRSFVKRGIPVSVNTDDPAMFGNSLAGEFSLLEEKLSFTRQDIRDLTLSAISTSWMAEDRKHHFIENFISDPFW